MMVMSIWHYTLPTNSGVQGHTLYALANTLQVIVKGELKFDAQNSLLSRSMSLEIIKFS